MNPSLAKCAEIAHGFILILSLPKTRSRSFARRTAEAGEEMGKADEEE
jgi:hypothetical protein